MKPSDDMWNTDKKAVQETWPVHPLRNSDVLRALVSDDWNEAASCLFNVTLRVHAGTNAIVVEAQGYWT